jgi:hypothetical protein
VTYALPAQAWVGPHQCAVITGLARAGINALVELAGQKTPRGRTGRLCDNPQVQDAVGRADAILNSGRLYRNAMIADLWNTLADGRETTLEQRARCRLAAVHAGDCARQAMDLMFRHGGSTSFKTASRLAEVWRDLQVVGQAATRAPEWHLFEATDSPEPDPQSTQMQHWSSTTRCRTEFGAATRRASEGGFLLLGRRIAARVTEPRLLGEFATWRAARDIGNHDLNSFRLRLDPTMAVDGLQLGMSASLAAAP